MTASQSGLYKVWNCDHLEKMRRTHKQGRREGHRTQESAGGAKSDPQWLMPTVAYAFAARLKSCPPVGPPEKRRGSCGGGLSG